MEFSVIIELEHFGPHETFLSRSEEAEFVEAENKEEAMNKVERKYSDEPVHYEDEYGRSICVGILRVES